MRKEITQLIELKKQRRFPNQPTYDDTKPETTRHSDAPLNAVVDAESMPTTDAEKEKLAQMMNKYGQHVTSMPKAMRPSLRRSVSLLLAVALFGAIVVLLLVRAFR